MIYLDIFTFSFGNIAESRSGGITEYCEINETIFKQIKIPQKLILNHLTTILSHERNKFQPSTLNCQIYNNIIYFK